MTIAIGEREFKVHKVIVCGQSEVFARMMKSKFKVIMPVAVKFHDVHGAIIIWARD